ncbi:hypothetical protein [Nocardiopsis sp. ATB16-24]|uniref:hypothetical protein n=1 Tax=Nocardiopsis sp. ATB16-24 TaxID=3019555 RepID=UPI0025541DF0|nr:hypothetical protein [Nocardiopsis sp. ATB16-24]
MVDLSAGECPVQPGLLGQCPRRCRQECEFFAFCQGGQASNKYFEHGDFTVTETAYCRNSKIELARALGEKMGV